MSRTDIVNKARAIAREHHIMENCYGEAALRGGDGDRTTRRLNLLQTPLSSGKTEFRLTVHLG